MHFVFYLHAIPALGEFNGLQGVPPPPPPPPPFPFSGCDTLTPAGSQVLEIDVGRRNMTC